MKYVYCYVAVDAGGVTLIDTGLNDQAGREAWKQAFVELNVRPQDVKTILLTHFHPDHSGLAGWLQEQTGAPVYISETDLAMIDRVWRNGDAQARKIADMAKANGVPEQLAEQIAQHMQKLNKAVHPLPELQPLPADAVTIGGEDWRIVPTPGHSDGHCCFYHMESRMLLAGDHILDKISPNISLWPGCRPNPLQDYVESLRRTAEMDISTALTAHGHVIRNVPERVSELLEHHEKRLEHMLALAAPGKSAYEVASEVFRHKELSPHQWRFAIAETLAHLEYLVAKGKLKKADNGVHTVYSTSIPTSTLS